jgi:antitoxin component YwqK of YwqJK toxin-antitoxin module
LKEGRGIEYDSNGQWNKYEGEWKCGVREGRGIEYYENGSNKKYEGEWVGGVREGTGIEYDKNGKMINGNWENNKLFKNVKK